VTNEDLTPFPPRLNEWLAPTGEVIPGFERSRCKLARHDPLRYEVTWSGRGERSGGVLFPTVARAALRFIIRRTAALYAFRFLCDDARDQLSGATS